MPKVIINRHQHKVQSIGAWVVMWLRRAGKNMQDLADEMGVTRQNVSYRVRNNSFTYSDLLTIIEFLQVPDEEILMVMKI